MRKKLFFRNIRLLVDLSDIDFDDGVANPSGIGDVVYAIRKKDIIAWPTISNNFNTASNLSEYTELSGNFTLASGKKWIRIYTTQGKGKITFDTTGEPDCVVFVNKASLSYPKLTKEARGFAKYAANGDYVFVVKHDGQFYVIGNPDYRSTVTPSGDSGDAAGSAKGMPLNIECKDTTPLPVYSGTLTLTDGSLNCSTGVFTPSGAQQQEES